MDFGCQQKSAFEPWSKQTRNWSAHEKKKRINQVISWNIQKILMNIFRNIGQIIIDVDRVLSRSIIMKGGF